MPNLAAKILALELYISPSCSGEATYSGCYFRGLWITDKSLKGLREKGSRGICDQPFESRPHADVRNVFLKQPRPQGL